jgi:hypothetical protein
METIMPRKTLTRSSLFISSSQRRFLILLVFCLVAGFSLLANSSASRVKPGKYSAGANRYSPGLPKQGDKQGCPHCGPEGDQSIYLPLIALPEAQGSELVFNSRSPEAMNVTPTFYEADGSIVAGEPVRIESAEIRYVNVKKLIPPDYRGARNWGHVAVLLRQQSRNVGATQVFGDSRRRQRGRVFHCNRRIAFGFDGSSMVAAGRQHVDRCPG